MLWKTVTPLLPDRVASEKKILLSDPKKKINDAVAETTQLLNVFFSNGRKT